MTSKKKFNLIKFNNLLKRLRLTVVYKEIQEITFVPSKFSAEIHYPIRDLFGKKFHSNLELDDNARYVFITSILHEIGHYLVAPKSRRKRKDFGIPAPSF